MGLLSKWAQQKKVDYFFSDLNLQSSILEVGSGSGWLKNELAERGYQKYASIDIVSEADIVGDINQWKEIGMSASSYDVIVAFEVMEHDDIEKSCFDLLKPGGKLFVTTPVPSRDWILKIMEAIGLNQKRTSPHSHLLDLRKDIKHFAIKRIKIVAGLGQWAVLVKS